MNPINKAFKENPTLKPFQRFVGTWLAEGSHGQMPGIVLTGETSIQWSQNGAFITILNRIDHPDFPDGITVIGSDDAIGTFYGLYFDERGVSRKQDIEIEGNTWKWSRITNNFSQYYTYILSDDEMTMMCHGTLSQDAGPFEKDLELKFTRLK